MSDEQDRHIRHLLGWLREKLQLPVLPSMLDTNPKHSEAINAFCKLHLREMKPEENNELPIERHLLSLDDREVWDQLHTWWQLDAKIIALKAQLRQLQQT